jgi:hypothetical protein
MQQFADDSNVEGAVGKAIIKVNQRLLIIEKWN